MTRYSRSSAGRPASAAAVLAMAIAFAALPHACAWAGSVGTAVAASSTVTGSGPGGSRTIVKDSPIFSDDRLKANRTGLAQIILVDKTKIVVGPDAQVDIDDYVYATEKTFKSITIKVTKGAIRFIGGRSNASAYKVVTPTGTIGLRG